jgi:hypothetical protein
MIMTATVMTYCMDFNAALKILPLDGEEQRTEPLERSKITTDPEKVDFSQPCSFLREVHAVPNALKDRCKGGDANSSTN